MACFDSVKDYEIYDQHEAHKELLKNEEARAKRQESHEVA
jgi:hypothetical protein